MSRMANWTDGPEYAPLDRPAAFQTPSVEPLQVPPVTPNPAAGAPVQPPEWQPPQAAVVPLEALVPAAGLPPRDPRVEFSTVSSLVTGGSAWGSAHSTAGTANPVWTPDQPLATSAVAGAPPQPAPASGTGAMPAAAPDGPPQTLNFPPPTQAAPSFPQPGTPDWFAPPPQSRWQPPDQSVSIAQLWHGATPGVMLTLLIGALINPVAPAMLALAGVLASRVKYRTAQVRRSFLWAAGLVVAFGVFSMFSGDFDLSIAWEVMSGWSQVVCWILLIAVPLQVGAGIRANEPPRRPD